MTDNPLKPYYQPSTFSTDVVMVRSYLDLPAIAYASPSYIQLADYTSYCFDGTVRLPRGVQLRLGLNNVIFANVRSQGQLVGRTTGTDGLIHAAVNCGDLHVRDITVTQEGAGPVFSHSVDSTGITRWDRMLITCAGGDIGTFSFAATIVTNTIATGFKNGLILDDTPSGVGFVFEDNSFVQADGTGGAAIVDLGVTVFGGIRFLHSSLVTAASGFGISGAAASANLPVGGVATLIGTRFSGAGTPLENIVVDDIRWQFIAPQGVRQSLTYAHVQISNNAVATGLAAAGTGVYVDVAGTSTVMHGAPRFDNGGANNCKIQYEGEFVVAPRVRVDMLITKVAVGTNDIGARITKNGVVLGVERRFPLTAAALGRTLSFEELDDTMEESDLYGVQLADYSVAPADATAVNVDLIVSTP